MPVPQPLFVDTRWIGYRKLAGVPLLDLPAGLAEADDTSPHEWRAEAAELHPRVAGILGTALNRAVEAFLTDDPPDPPPARAFSHNDLGAEHVLVDPATGEITGVIDWTDAAVTDPAYDFGLVLRDLGRDGLSAALTAYRDPVDDRRITFYAVCKALEDLEYGLRVERYRENALAALRRLL